MVLRDHIHNVIARYQKTIAIAFIVMTVACAPRAGFGQSAFRMTSFGTDLGGTLFSNSAISGPISGQYHFFGRHSLGKGYMGEANLGLVFLSNPARRSRLFSLDYRILIPFKAIFSSFPIDNGINPYLYGGLGTARYQRINVKVQNDPLLRKSDGAIPNTSIWNNGNGWVAQIPLGVGTDIQLSDEAALRLTAGYNIFAGKSVLGAKSNWEGFLGATAGLKFYPFGNDWDNDRITTADELYNTRTYPNNPDSDGDGLRDGQELYFYKTDPLSSDTDGDGLTDGEEILTYHTNPLIVDTDGGLVSDGEEVQRSSDPNMRADDLPSRVTSNIVAQTPESRDVVGYRSLGSFHYGTLKYEWHAADEPSLRKALQLLKIDHSLKIKATGYADERGDSVMNCSLSNLRSWNIQKYFLERGISPDRIYGIGLGEIENAVNANSYAANRRTEIRLAYRIPPFTTEVGDENLPAVPADNKNLIPEDAIQFAPYSDQLDKKAERWLKALAKYLTVNKGYAIQIIGTTDGSGSEAVNTMLHEARAASVAKYLVNIGVSFDRLQIVDSPAEVQKRSVIIRRGRDVGH